MSLWGFDGEENSLTSWSSLSQFDEAVWSEFGSTNGNNAEPNALCSPSSWLPNEDRRKRILGEGTAAGPSGQEKCGASAVKYNIVAGMSSEDVDASDEVLLLEDAAKLPSVFVEGGWADLQSVAADISAESGPFDADRASGRQESEQILVDGVENLQSMDVVDRGAKLDIRGENTGVVTNSLSVTDVSLQDEATLDMFEKEVVPSRSDSLLELGWENIGNLDEMDKLFRNNSFEPVMVNGADVLDWPSPSPTPNVADIGISFEKSSPISGSALVKIESRAEDKASLIFGGSLPRLCVGSLDDVIPSTGSPRTLRNFVNGTVEQPSLRCSAGLSYDIHLGKDAPEEGTAISSASYPETGKVSLAQVYPARRQAAHRKRSEDRSKRTPSYRKLFPGPPYSIPRTDFKLLQSLSLKLPGQTPYLQCTSASPLQSFPLSRTAPIMSPPQVHGVPHIHGGYPLHLLPTVSAPPTPPVIHIQNIGSMGVDLPLSNSEGQRQQARRDEINHLASSAPFDTSSPPPASSLNMTRQEKLEKLRWRQQLQAKMAVEQQQQLLALHNAQQKETPICRTQAACQGVESKQAGGRLAYTSEKRLVRSLLSADQRIESAEDNPLPQKDRGAEDKYSLEGSVLRQLKSTVSALDLGTRLCIRDALFRLARSAMDRRAVENEYMTVSQGSEEQDSDINAVESSTASGPPVSQHSRCTNMSTVETETNPIDRSIANLLFSKPQPPMFGRHYVYTE